MLISYNWIKDWIPTLTESPEEVAEALSNALAEVESIRTIDSDYVLEIENKALSHRGDLFGQLGLAREIAATLKKDYISPKTRVLDSNGGKAGTASQVSITIDNTLLSPRYSAAIIENVKITESPVWLKQRLSSVGIRSINNIVDVTNYLMFKYGQPLHAFDLDLLTDIDNTYHLGVRKAQAGEKLILLDDTELLLTEDDLIITNNTSENSLPIALAGVMGGQPTQVSDATKKILLESANFDQFSIRASSRKHSIRSEASLRFEKGIDPESTLPTLLEALEMITGETGTQYIIDSYHQNIRADQTITLSNQKINQYLNTSSSTRENQSTLERLGITCTLHDNDTFECTIPSFRKDLTIKEDLYEEIGRMYNYNKIEPTLPSRLLRPNRDNDHWRFKNYLRDILVRTGLYETLSYSFVDKPDAGIYTVTQDNQITHMQIADISAVRLQNTLSPEFAYMRSSLIPSIQNVVTENAKRFDNFSVFEINPVVIPKDNELPSEPVLLTFASYIRTKQPNEVVQHAKSIWLRLLDELNIDSDLRKLLPTEIEIEDVLGYSFGYEIDTALLLQARQNCKYKQISVSPPTKQDISFFLDTNQLIGPLVELMHEHAGPSLKTIELLDIYQSQEMQKQQQKSVTVRLIFEDPKRSISDSEINPIRLEIEKLLVQEFGATIR